MVNSKELFKLKKGSIAEGKLEETTAVSQNEKNDNNGFSTHEDPSNLNAIRVAHTKGARLFEKHVGIPTEEIKLNAYSASPEQVEAWLRAYKEAVEACGHDGERVIEEREMSDLRSLTRGVYARKEIKARTPIKGSDVFFAMPLLSKQLTSGRFKEGLVGERDYGVNEPLSEDLRPAHKTRQEIIYTSVNGVKYMLNEARIPIGHDFSVEVSHHYGLERFHEVGCTIIECINREYAKKLIVQLPGQWNPVHYHKKKDETFQVLRGVLEVEIEGNTKILHPGDSLWIPRGVWHGFGSKTGVIFEEVSTASFNDDSFYIDRAIAKLPREERKTHLVNWGRHQF
jgi:N-acetylneuraminate synthase